MNVELASLWLPIVLSGVAVFFLSFLMWMVVGHHKTDWSKLPNEDAVIAALRSNGVTTGQYVFPHCVDPKQMKDPAFVKKYETGPTGFLFVRKAGACGMGPQLLQSFVFNLIVSVLVAYVATVGLRAGADGKDVFRVAMITAWLAYCGAEFWGSIWMAAGWAKTWKGVFDSALYGAATGALFAWQWPSIGG